MAVFLSPVGGVAAQFFTNTGAVLTGGKLYTYLAGTTTPAATYTSAAGATFNTNPIVLDAAGRVPGSGEIWLGEGVQYKFVLKDSNDVLIGTYDNVTGINSNFVNYNALEEIQVATAGQTVFNLTNSYQPGTNTLSVFVDGVNQYDGSSYSYVETSSTRVTFTQGLHVGALVKFTTATTLSAGVVSSNLVTYLPAGTGAVATTVQAKLRQTVSVMDFGATGDGTTDDTAAIQAAIDYANSIYTSVGWGKGGAEIYLPGGRYKHSGLILKPGVNLRGDGQFNTILALSGTGTTALKSPAATSGLAADVISPIIEELAFISDETTPSGQTMLNAIGFIYSTFRNVNFEWCGGCSGVTVLNSTLAGSGGPSQWYNQFYSCNFLRLASRPSGGIALQLGDTNITKEQITTWSFFGGRISGAGGGTGLVLRGTGNKFFAVTFEGMDTACYIGSTGTRGAETNAFMGCYWEGNTVNRYIYANGLNTSFFGSFITGGTDTFVSDSVYEDETGGYKNWLPSAGVWQITMNNGAVKRPKLISKGTISGLDFVDNIGNNANIYIQPQTSASFNYLNAAINFTTSLWESGSAAFSPGDDNLKTLGRSSMRWSTVYAATGAINTSDVREKQQIRNLSDAETAVAIRLKSLIKAFKFNDAVQAKGDNARIHFGVMAHEVKAAFESEGLVAENYAILCYDEWEAEPEMLDDDGAIIRAAKPAGNRYGIRYEELLAFVITAL